MVSISAPPQRFPADCVQPDLNFGELFESHARAVYNFCFRRTGDWTVSEDLTSVVFLEAWRKREGVDLVGEPPLPWLLGVANNVLRNHRRSLRRAKAALKRMPEPRATPDFADDLAGRLDDETRMKQVISYVARLPRHEREVLEMTVWAELSYEDTARALGVPVGTVRSRLARARARLTHLAGASVCEAVAGKSDVEGGDANG